MTQIIKDVVTWLKQWFYTESEVDNLLYNSRLCMSDVGVTGNTNPLFWYNHSNVVTVSTDANGTTLTGNTSVGYYFVAPLTSNISGASNYKLYNKWIVEFDLVDFNRAGSNIAINITDDSSHNIRFVGNGVSHMDMSDDFRGHIKLSYDENGFHYKFGEGTEKTLAFTFTTHSFSFVLPANTSSYLKFKNFKMKAY